MGLIRGTSGPAREIRFKDSRLLRFGERRSEIPVIKQDSFRRAVRKALPHSPFQARVGAVGLGLEFDVNSLLSCASSLQRQHADSCCQVSRVWDSMAGCAFEASLGTSHIETLSLKTLKPLNPKSPKPVQSHETRPQSQNKTISYFSAVSWRSQDIVFALPVPNFDVSTLQDSRYSSTASAGYGGFSGF